MTLSPSCRACFLLVAWVSVSSSLAQTPQWIWSGDSSSGNPQTVWFRRTFQTPPYMWNARLAVAADDSAEVYLNGKPVATCLRWDQPVRAEVSMRLNQGQNVLAVRARNQGGPAGLLLHLNLGGGESREVISDTNWVFATAEQAGWNTLQFDSRSWLPAVNLGPHGMNPWGDLLSGASATAAETLRVLPDFRVELLRSATRNEGSWVAMAFDERGRLYLSPEGDSKPLLRFTFDTARQIDRIEAVPAPIRFAMGLLAAQRDLYANARGPEGTGLYRLTDANGNDRFDTNEVRLLKSFRGSGEHGYHALAMGPDEKIYVLNGNGTRLPEGLSPESPYRNYREDVLSLNPDETSRPGGALAPGCTILRTDLEGRHWEVFAGGMRNAYGFAFNTEGELFAYDSDNEWDWGTPWYRPTRVFHCVSGAEMGWRDGARAWPDHYPDMVPGVVDIGIGSPCGAVFGTHARFPDKYRRALFLQDWSYGRILAVHLEPRGASYRASFEEFLRGQPLNLTSMAVGPDGALYFVTGGRGTQSGLYRVTYSKDPSIAVPSVASSNDTTAKGARALRHRLESFHGRADASAVDVAWAHLGSADPSLRFAARVALESQPTVQWKNRALEETGTNIALGALLALARVGDSATQPALLRALGRFPLASLTETQRLWKLRIVQLSFVRHGRPDEQLAALAREKLGPRYGLASWPENRELARLLIYLETPGIVGRTLDLMDKAPSQEEQIHYLSQLRHLRSGWTTADRQRYFEAWLKPRDHLVRPDALLHGFHDVGRDYVDGASLNLHLETFRREAFAALPETERSQWQSLFDQPIPGAQLIPALPRQFVQEWRVMDFLPVLDDVGRGRDFDQGRRAFIDTQCYTCHRLGNAGGGVGPELTAVAAKYSRRDLLETLLEPSKVISEQFQDHEVYLKDGEDVTGRLVRQSDEEVVVEVNHVARMERIIPRSAISEIRPSKLSPMPDGLLNVLTKDEVLDLLAFLESGGKPDAAPFTRPPRP